MKDDKNKKKSGAGFYIALCCCVAAVGIVGFVNSRNKQAGQGEPHPTYETAELPVITLSPDNSSENDIAVEAEAPKLVEEKKALETVPSEEEKENKWEMPEDADVIESGENEDFYEGDVVESISIAETPKFVMPVEGEICCGFSGDTLYYDATMGDFRTHNGIDIKADADTDVVASADGVIEAVYTDTLGKTVIINHNNGYRTKYSNLDDIENLKEGMELSEGDFIAHVGSYAYGENTTEPHIHFEIILDDVYVDPEEYIK